MERKVFIEKCDEVRKYWGEIMPMMVMEEAGELIQAISKYERGVTEAFCIDDDDTLRKLCNDLIDEIGDMYILLMALQLQYECAVTSVLGKTLEELIEDRIEKKLNKKY